MASDLTTGPAAAVPDPTLSHAEVAAPSPAAVVGVNGHHAPPPPRPPGRRGRLVKAILAVAAVVGLIGAIAVRGPERSKADAHKAYEAAKHFLLGPDRSLPPKIAEAPPPRKFSGLITVSPSQREALGMLVTTVQAQDKPVQLELTGTTDFDQNTLRKIRPLFDARVTQVFKTTGQMVQKGDALVELYSTNMAAAKADYRSKYAQWQHDLKLVESRRPLAGVQVSNVQWVDTLIAELTSRVNYLQAEDKLITYGIPASEIKQLQVDLLDEVKREEAGKGNLPDKAHSSDLQDISRLVLYAPIDGMIVERDVVSGNFYDDMAVLMVISPMDKLWVWGNVYEKDQAEVHLGQTCEIYFPYLNDMKVVGKVEHIAARVDPNTRTLKVRATIDNPGKQLKAEQLVRAVLEIPVVPGQTVIQRNALAVINGQNCVFVQSRKDPNSFERRLIEVDQENHDIVVVRNGLAPGEKVVTVGSLILSQLYEDESTVSSGMPLQ